MDRITDALQNRKLSACLGLDIQKAFDTVDHDILFEKFENVGIRGPALDFFKSYYKDRKQYIKVNGVTSDDFLIIPRSVMQGTVLGVIGFLIFINDLPNATQFAENFIFADDLNSVFTADSHEELEEKVNTDLQNLLVYYSVNKLSVHPQKSTVLLFKNKLGRHKYKMKETNGLKEIDFNCKLNGTPIRVANNSHEDNGCVRILGIYLDESLTFKYQSEILQKKLMSAMYSIKRTQDYLNTMELKLLYNAFFKSHMNYSVPFLYACNEHLLDNLHRTEKRMIRIVEKRPNREHSAPLFKKNNILPIKDSITFYESTFMFKVHKEKQPNSINELWEKAYIHRQNTNNTRQMRNYNEIDFAIPNRVSYAHLNKLPKFHYPKTFNDLDMSIKESQTLGEFQNKLKASLLSRL